MTIAVKTASNYSQINQPYFKTESGWIPLKKVFYKQPNNTWVEVWPQTLYYIHTGYGYQMSVAQCFNNPTSPSTFVFINNGYIGGALGGEPAGGTTNFALQIGTFPAGSTVIVINNWVISGAGGDGASYYGNRTVYLARRGGHGLLVNYPIQLDNTNGYIRGGGGGGGARGEWGGKNDNHAPGGGGAGIPGGRANISGWNPTLYGDGAIDYWPNQPGTELLGGRNPGWTGAGGDAGQNGQRMTNNISKDGQYETGPGTAGFAVVGVANITSSQGFVAGKIVGPTS